MWGATISSSTALAPGALACGLLGVAVELLRRSPAAVLQLTHAGGLLLLLDLLLGGGGEEVRVARRARSTVWWPTRCTAPRWRTPASRC